MNFLVYLSGPIAGLTYNEGQTWRTIVSDSLHPCISTLSPLRGKKDRLQDAGKITNFNYEDNALTSSKGITGRDRFDCTRADAIFVNLLGATKISIGTVMEIAWADAHRIPIILVMEKDNAHVHPILTQCVTYWTESLEDGITLLHNLVLPDEVLNAMEPNKVTKKVSTGAR